MLGFSLRRTLACTLRCAVWVCLAVAHSPCNAQTPSAAQQPASPSSMLDQLAGVQEQANQWPAGSTPRQELPTDRALDYEFSKVAVSDIVGWLDWLGVELPVEASGTLSGWLWGQRGTTGWFNFGDYRIEGEVTSPELHLDRWQIDQAALRFGYADGEWYIGHLRGRVRAEASEVAIGQANLAARIPTAADGRIETLGTIDAVDLSALLAAFDVDLELESGSGTLRISGNAPLSRADDLTHWDARAALQLNQLNVEGIPTADLQAQARLQAGKWSLVRGQLDWLAQPIRITGSGRIDGDFPYQFAIQGADIALDQLLRDFEQPALAEQLNGPVSVSAQATGSAKHGITTASAELASPELWVFEQRVEELQTGLKLKDQGVAFEVVSARLAGGNFSGTSRWTTVEQLTQGIPTVVELRLARIELAQLSRRLLPTAVTGMASGILAFESERSEAGSDQRQWQSSGNLNVTALAGLGIEIGDAEFDWTKQALSPELAARILASDGAIELNLRGQLTDQPTSELKHSQLSGYSAEGTLRDFVTVLNLAAAGIDFSPSLNLPANELERLPIRASGSFDVDGEPQNWLNAGRIELTRLDTKIDHRELTLQQLILLFTPDEFRLQQFQLIEARGRVAGAAVYRRQAAGRHQINLRLADIQLSDYAPYLTADPAAQTLTGLADFETRLSKPAENDPGDLLTGWTGNIDAQLSEIALKDLLLGSLDLQAQLADERLTANMDGQLLQRPATLTASVPRSWFDEPLRRFSNNPQEIEADVLEDPTEDSAEDFAEDSADMDETMRFNINWQAVELARLMQAVTALPLPTPLRNSLMEFNLATLSGIADIDASIRRSTDTNLGFEGWQGELAAEMRQVRYQSVDVGELALESTLSARRLSAKLVGNLFAGDLTLDADLPASLFSEEINQAELPPATEEDLTFSANLRGVDLRRLMMLTSNAKRGSRYTGIATLSAEGRVDASGELQASVNLSVPDLWQDRKRLARNLIGQFAYANGGLRVERLSGGVAGGTIEARGGLPLTLLASTTSRQVAPRDQLQFAARRIEIGELVEFLNPDYAAQFSGLVSYRGRVRFERQIGVVGSFRGSNAFAFGLPIQAGHGELRMKFNSDGSFAQLSTTNLSGTVIGGDFTGDIELRGGPSLTLAASGRVGRGKLDQLSRSVGFEHVVGTGKFDAAINLQSRNAASLAALTGAVEIDFESGDTQSLPILRELGRFVPLLQLASTDITGGTLYGYIGQGQLRIRDFILLGDAFWIVGQGNAGLLSNRLDIEAVLETGGGITQQLSQAALTRLAVGIVPQAALLAELNNLLSNRSVYFHIGGTTGKPVIQARPAQSLGKALLQNVQRQLLAAPSAALLDHSD